MAKFDKAFAITMKNEGGYANNPNDRGGETWRGIARNFWGKWAGWKTVDEIKSKVGLAKISALNLALAANIDLEKAVLSFYKEHFWDEEKLDSINDQAIANQLFDTAVNMGTKTASIFLQKAANTILAVKLVVDGMIGSKSVIAVNSLPAEKLYNAICELRKAKYEAIIANKPSQAQFRKSWFSRIKPYENLG